MMTEELYKSCRQCPRGCARDRTAKAAGFCGETAEIRAAAACLHFGEEPPVTGRGGSGTIFFTGCTLRCAFCQNYQISQDGMGRVVPEEEFVQICLALQNAGAENINLVTGSHLIPALADCLRAARNAGCAVPFCWNSSAYESVEMLEMLKDLVSIWLPDLKTLDGSLAKRLFAAEDYPQKATEAVSWMIRNFPPDLAERTENGVRTETLRQGVIVRHLFLPGRFAETADTLDWLKKNADGRALVSLMSQYTPVPFHGQGERAERRADALSAIENRLVNQAEDADLRDLIEAYNFEYLFYQELSDDTSWLPDFSNTRPFPNRLARPVWHWQTGFVR